MCGMPMLLNAYKQVAHEYGFDIAQILLTLGDFEDHRRFLNTKNTVHRLLQSRIMPIVNENDTITTEEIRVGDNDRLAAKIAQMVQAQDFIILTGVDGLYDRNPSEDGAMLVEELDPTSASISRRPRGISTLGTGGHVDQAAGGQHGAERRAARPISPMARRIAPLSSVLRGERRCTKCIAHAEPGSVWTNVADRPAADGRQPDRAGRGRRAAGRRRQGVQPPGRRIDDGRLHPRRRAPHLRRQGRRTRTRPERLHRRRRCACSS